MFGVVAKSSVWLQARSEPSRLFILEEKLGDPQTIIEANGYWFCVCVLGLFLVFVFYEVCFVPGCVYTWKATFYWFMCVLWLSRVFVFPSFSQAH